MVVRQESKREIQDSKVVAGRCIQEWPEMKTALTRFELMMGANIIRPY